MYNCNIKKVKKKLLGWFSFDLQTAEINICGYLVKYISMYMFCSRRYYVVSRKIIFVEI